MGKKNREPKNSKISYYVGLTAVFGLPIVFGAALLLSPPENKTEKKEKPAAVEKKPEYPTGKIPAPIQIYPLKECPLDLAVVDKSRTRVFDYREPVIIAEYGFSKNESAMVQYLLRDFETIEVTIPEWQVNREKILENPGRIISAKRYWYADNAIKPRNFANIDVEVFGVKGGKETVVYKGNLTSK